MKPIDEIVFGYSDGKNEARQSNFESLFYDGGDYHKLKNNPLKFLVIGRKGTGKTLLVRYFMSKAQKEKDTCSKFIIAGDFTSEKLKNFDYILVKEEEREIFWRYLILKELTSMVIENEKGFLNRKWLAKLREVDTKLSYSLEELVQENGIEASAQGGITPKGGSGSAKLSSHIKDTSKYTPAPYFSQMDELTDTLMNVMKRAKKKYFLLFDDLDEIKLNSMQRMDGENNVTILAKLLNDFVTALSYVNNLLLDIGNESRVISTLRKDVVDQMQLYGSNINKVVTDNGVMITWFSPMIRSNPQRSALGKLVLHKIRASVSAYSKIEDYALFNAVFHKSSGKSNPLKYIVDRGFGRPRDVIRYLNLIQEKFPEATSITYKMASQVQGEYCSWFFDELQNEISILENHDSIAGTIDLIKRNGKTVFSYADLNEIISNSDNDFSKIVELKRDLKSLYALGAIGTHERKEGGSKPTIEYSYRDGADNPDFTKNFVVHPALKNYLSIR